MKKFALIVSVFLITACASATGSSITTGKTRLAIEPDSVKVFLEYPAQYEVIGIVEAKCQIISSDQTAQDKAVEELKNQASKLGANGVLLLAFGSQAGATAVIQSGNVFVPVSPNYKTVSGKAIFVTNP